MRNRLGLCDACLTKRQAEAKQERADQKRKEMRQPPAAELNFSRRPKNCGLRRPKGLHIVAVLLALLAFAGGWVSRGFWDLRDRGRASAECEALATYSQPGFRIGPYQPVSRQIDSSQWAACMRGKGFEPRSNAW
jgi:hypothetical protein